MRVIPLTGQVLIELDERERFTTSGLAIPEHTVTPEEHQQRARKPSPPPGVTGRVVEIGPWPRLKNGMMRMPDFGIGAKVVIRPTSGIELHWETSCRLKMLSSADILAVLT
jgi:co-chaperonin GroES (HSP10)